MKENKFFCFGDFQLDTDSRKLSSGERIISDDDKVIKLLENLCCNYPEVVDKQKLIDALWPDQVVTDWSLSRLISDTRQLLGDSGKDQGNIKTIRGRGFRLNVAVESVNSLDFSVKKSSINTLLEKKRTLDESHYFRRHKLLATGMISVVSAVIIFFAAYFSGVLESFLKNSQVSAQKMSINTIRVAVLPVDSEDKDPIDDWVKIGVMSLAVEQLGLYQHIQTIPVTTILTTLQTMPEKFGRENLTAKQAGKICQRLGCTHLVSIRYRLENKLPLLSYQIFNKESRSAISEFSQKDIINTLDMLLDHLASDLIPVVMQRLSLANTYSKNSKANRDYAIGVHELFSGDINSAEDYLNIALKKDPNFFWASAYFAEAEYRAGKFSIASEIIDKLALKKISNKQSYFLEHLKSNILYGQGKIKESLAATQKLLKNTFVLDDPLLRGNELLNLGSSYQALGQLTDAISAFKKSTKAYHQANFGAGEGRVLYNLGNVYLSSSKDEIAIDYYQQAKGIF